MCIICRGRYEQGTLTRFQINNGKLIEFSKAGRSSYICKDCILLDGKRLTKIFSSKFRQKIDDFGTIVPTKET